MRTHAALNEIRHLARALWRCVRTLTRDDAYERYLQHHERVRSGNSAPLDRRAFYLREQQRKWSGISRCC